MRRPLFAFFYFFLCLVAANIYASKILAQDNAPHAGMGVEVNVFAGKILKHTGKIKSDIPTLSTAIDLNLIQQTFGDKTWHKLRRYPVIGLGFTYTNYGNNEVYGSCYSLYPNLEIPFITGKNFEWTTRLGYGIAYATRPFHRAPSWDTINNAIGSHLNAYALVSTDFRYRLNAHWDLQLGGQFTHISNGSARLPNYGINFYGAHMGLRYFPVTSRPNQILNPTERKPNRWLAQARLGMAVTEYAAIDGASYPAYLVSLYASKRYWQKNKLQIGLDYSYHEHITAFQKNNEINPDTEKQHSWKGAFFVGNELLFGKAFLHMQVGVYLKQAALVQEKFYQKIGWGYYFIQQEKGILKELGAYFDLKTHKANAELLEFGIVTGF